MNALDLLTPYQISEAELHAMVGPANTREALVLVGSIAEGLGNSDSDVDFIMVGRDGVNGALAIGEARSHLSMVNRANGTLMEFNVWPPDAIATLGERFRKGVESMTGVDPNGKLEDFKEHELLILHRLRVGLVVDGHDRVRQWRDAHRLDLLPDYIFFAAMQSHHAQRQDIRAQLAAGNGETARLMTQHAALTLSAAVLGTVGESNPTPKWRLALIDRHRDRIGPQHADLLKELHFVSLVDDPKARFDKLVQGAIELMMSIFKRRPELAQQAVKLQERLGWKRLLG